MLPQTLRDLPYLVHTNRELGLMLQGKKPLAYFMEFMERTPEVVARYLRLMDHNVKRGRLGKRVVLIETEAPPEFGKRQQILLEHPFTGEAAKLSYPHP